MLKVTTGDNKIGMKTILSGKLFKYNDIGLTYLDYFNSEKT